MMAAVMEASVVLQAAAPRMVAAAPVGPERLVGVTRFAMEVPVEATAIEWKDFAVAAADKPRSAAG